MYKYFISNTSIFKITHWIFYIILHFIMQPLLQNSSGNIKSKVKSLYIKDNFVF